MADDTKQRGAPDTERINMNQDYEVRYWAKKFGVTEQRLHDAVKVVGVMAKDVQQHLRK